MFILIDLISIPSFYVLYNKRQEDLKFSSLTTGFLKKIDDSQEGESLNCHLSFLNKFVSLANF